MNFLHDKCRLRVLTRDLLLSSKPFTCGEADLDSFFREDAVRYADEMLGKTYCYVLNDNPQTIACIFTVSNESVRADVLPRSRRDKLNKAIPYEKRMRRYPAVLIGRLGVSDEYKDKGIGTELVDILKSAFTDKEYRTACRYIVVDAYNNNRTINFYENKCNFSFLFSSEEQEAENSQMKLPLKTRYMYFDLKSLEQD